MKKFNLYEAKSQDLKFLGRGAGFLPSEGNTSAYIKEEGNLYLFDCGELVFSKIIEKGILKDIDSVYIFITHLHTDHIGSLGTLLNYLYYTMNIVANVYYMDNKLLSILTKTGLELDKEFSYICLSDVTVPYEYIKVTDEFSIMYNKTKHANLIATSFTFHYHGVVRFYSGDTALTSFDWINFLLMNENAKALYIDTGLIGNEYAHVSVHTLAKNISPEFRDRVWCMHIDSLDVIPIAKEYGFNVVEVD